MRNSATIELIGYVYGEPKYPMPDKYPNWISFSVSVTEKYKDKAGVEQKKVEWFKCNSWNEKLSGIIQQYVQDGSGLLIKGKPKAAKPYTDKEGNIQSGNIDVNIVDLNILTYPTDKKEKTTYGTTSLNKGALPQDSNGRHKVNKQNTSQASNELIDDELPF